VDLAVGYFRSLLSLPDTTAFSGKRFDLICLFDVLEHIQDDALALRTAAGLLKPAGRLLITVPATPGFGLDTTQRITIKRRYTRESLANLAQMAGLKVERIGYFNSLLFPAIAAARLLGKLTGGDNESDAKTPSRLVNSVLQNIFQSERHVLRRRLFPFGTSVLATFTMPT
jgi:2-polyprenyl-3-methyl-5-hydroxy-6-metoxy-1,4-benzoquinol methylase